MSDVAQFDLRALINDRRSKESRPIIRHTLCIDASLVMRRRELAETEAEIVAENLNEGSDKPRGGYRTGRGQRLSDVRSQIAGLDKEIEAASVIVVFRALTSAKMQAALDESKESGSERDLFHALAVQTFVRFERDGEQIVGGVEELRDLLDDLSLGEMNAIGSKITEVSLGQVDVPFSVKQSLARLR